MKIISFNVNGIRAINRKGKLIELINTENPDIICLQEIKCNDVVCETEIVANYSSQYPYIYYNTSKTRKGYSGTAILSKIKPKSVVYDLVEHDNDEGRVLTLVFSNCILVTVYTPNSGAELKRLEYRVEEWDIMFKRYIKGLSTRFQTRMPIILCGDLNCAHKDIDIYNPKIKCAGSMPEERSNFEDIMHDAELIDSFREHHPSTIRYSYWSYLGQSRIKNNGWRIDYFLVSKMHTHKITHADILTQALGSDHAPIVLEINV
jgi:exodeoxyribonuclease-3